MKETTFCKDLTCITCNENFEIHFENYCHKCHPRMQQIEKMRNEIKYFTEEIKDRAPPKSSFFRFIFSKKLALSFIVYLPVAIFIGLKFGYLYELSFVAGTIYIYLSTIIIDWLDERL